MDPISGDPDSSRATVSSHYVDATGILSTAWLRLGEVEEKLKAPQAAKDAYTKYLEVASDAKNAAEIRKKLDKLK